MRIMSLDLSTKSSGVAIFDDMNCIYAQCVASASDDVYTRIKKITKRIEEIFLEYKPDKIIAEEPEPAFVSNNLNTYRKLTFVHGAICLMLHDYKKTMALCTSSHWRAGVGIKTGRGVRRSELKLKDIQKAKQLFPHIDIKNDDVADAVLIGYSFAKENSEVFNWG